MKTVFSNSQLCHVWAQQTQERGRGSNMYFQGDEIYSYGSHFLAAKIFTRSKHRLALVNERRYSSSTSRHLSGIRSALRGLIPYIEVPNPSDLGHKLNIEFLESRIYEQIDSIFGSGKIKYRDGIKYQMEYLQSAVKDFNLYQEFTHGNMFKIPEHFEADLREHLEYRYQRYLQSQTLEALQKANLERDKKQARALKLAETAVTAWIQTGESQYLKHIRELNLDFIRVNGNEVVTTRQATVPLPDAKRLLMALLNGKNIEGSRIGSFTIDRVEGDLIKAGCHRLSLKQVREVLEVAS